MSLSDQSLQFFPVSARVSAVRARGLRIKGKDGTNDAYAALQAGRETFRTPVSEKRAEPVWGGDDAAFIFTMPPEAADLQVRVLHRVPLGADKLLGLAVVDVHELRRDSERENPQWFKLLNKAGKADKERGEVLLDVQFLKSSMSVSMIDLSDKSHSRLGKFKDKLRGKKKDGLSDSASAILPSVTQVLTDSEEEMDEDKDTKKKKKNKLKSLFVPKSNMKRNSLSQSMSALGTLPDKNSSISSSTSSGLNVESSEGKKKKKFTFLTHKRTGSTDSKASNQSDFTNGSTNQNPASQIDICINGSHIYKEETQSEEVREMNEEEEEDEEEGEKWRREREEQERLEEMRRREAIEERKRKEKEEQRRKEEEEKERMRVEQEKEERRRMEEEERNRIRMEREMEERERIRMEREKEERKRMEEKERERIQIEKEKEEIEKIRIEREKEERERIKMEREKEEERRRMEEEERQRIRIEREKEEMRRMEEEERERISREREKEERRRMEEEERDRIRIEREKEEQKRRMDEGERERISREREKEIRRRMEEEERDRIRIEREKEEQKKRMDEEEKERIRMEREREKQMKSVEEERERQRIEKEEQRAKMEEERKRMREKETEAEELRRKEESDRKKAEEEEMMRIAEEEKKQAERTQMMEEEEKEKVKRAKMERKLAEEKEAREEEKRRIEEENEKRRKEEERVREEKERKRAEMELKRKEEEKERRNMEMEEKKKKEKQMRDDQERLRKEDVLFEERVTTQSTDFTRSARISNVKPSVSVPATVSQPSMVNRNPFLDDDLDSSILENVLSVETTAKKGPAPLPPHEKPQLTGPDGSHSKDISKRPAPQPPGMLKMTGKLMDQPGLGQEAKKNPEKHYESKVTSVSEDDTQADTNPFTWDESVAVKPGQIPTPKPRMKTGNVHLGETETNSNGNPAILRAVDDITAEDVKSNLSDNLSERKEHLEDKVEPAKPNDLSYVNQNFYPEPQIAGLLNSESSQKKSRAPLPPSKPKRTGDLSRPQTMPCLPNKTNLEQSHESRGNQKGQDNSPFSSEIRAINTSSSATGPSLTFSPLTEKSQVMKPCAANSVDMGSGSQSRTLPWAKVVPNDAGEVKEQVVLTSVIRQHAVKPLSAAEPEMYESRVSDKTQPNTKVAEAVKGPYSQLTQAELISLVLRQQEQLSQRDARIQELEQYIDNLLVHVMEEKPSILMSMNAMKKSV
ncbi:rab11 family-interacting protein 1 isoform X2 [Silurus asotus]|uniref:Rab11 family-interacting protein 1 isoform X2 n=1 Tax=Silurus asotus TaxID=30991 RepID=A0AAD5AD73_SILAS|nr:rab11 family-interacting protein 1 isoform X2 [Silurus asotus]